MSNTALAIVPCYNEEASIASVVARILEDTNDCDVLVVSDGSSDSSAAKARQAGALVLELPCNLGIGGAMQAGYQFAARKHYQCAIQVDGDGQHPTKEISTLLEVVRSGRADLVVGSRYVDVGRLKGRVSSLSRVFGGTILCYWLAVLSGKSIKDPTSGFRAMNRGVFTLFAREYPSDYPEPISLLMLLRRSFSICEVGVKMNERTQGTSSIRSLHSVLYMLKVIWRMTLERVFR